MKLRRNAWSAGALPQTPLGELTALPRPSSSIKSTTSKGEGGGGEKKEGEGRGEGREEEGEVVLPTFQKKVTHLVSPPGCATK